MSYPHPTNLYLTAQDVTMGISDGAVTTGSADIYNDQVTFYGENMIIKKGLTVEGELSFGNADSVAIFNGSVRVAGNDNVGSSTVRGDATVWGHAQFGTAGVSGLSTLSGGFEGTTGVVDALKVNAGSALLFESSTYASVAGFKSIETLDAQVQWLFKALYLQGANTAQYPGNPVA